ncbi:mannose-6-phosphate isomerase, partial [Klebsiella oxytoca]
QDGKPRELHIEKSIDVITVPAKSVEESVINIAGGEKNVMNRLIACSYYQVWKLDVDGRLEVSQDYPFLVMSVVEGD